MTPFELIKYYQSLLIVQYSGKPKASGHIGALASMGVLAQTSVKVLTFSVAPTSGTFTLKYGGNTTAAINWNDTAASVQTKLQALSGLASVTVVGSIAAGLTVTFTGVPPVASALVVASNALLPVSVPSITETDVTLPLAVQGAFNLTGTPLAAGVQLDILGKYAGVTRTGNGLHGTVTLDDSDFLSFIKIATARNSLTSDLFSIVGLLYQFFPNEMYVFDHTDMTMDYLISSSVGSQSLVQLFVTEDLLPRPMGVAIRAIIYNPTVNNFFSFRTYLNPASPTTATGFNSYTSYNLASPWLSYSMNI